MHTNFYAQNCDKFSGTIYQADLLRLIVTNGTWTCGYVQALKRFSICCSLEVYRQIPVSELFLWFKLYLMTSCEVSPGDMVIFKDQLFEKFLVIWWTLSDKKLALQDWLIYNFYPVQVAWKFTVSECRGNLI